MPAQTRCRVLGAWLVYLLDWGCMRYFSPCYNRISDESTLREEGFLCLTVWKTLKGKRGSMRVGQLAAWHLQSESREPRELLLSSLPLYFVFSPVPQSTEWWRPHLEWVISPQFSQSENSLINTPKGFSPSWVLILQDSFTVLSIAWGIIWHFFLITEKSLLQISSSANTGKPENRNRTLYTHLSLKNIFQNTPKLVKENANVVM